MKSKIKEENMQAEKCPVDLLVSCVYICVSDKGGRSPTCADMAYRLPKSYLIKVDRYLNNFEIDHLLKSIAKTRICPKIIGTWTDGEHDYLEKVLLYDDLNLSS